MTTRCGKQYCAGCRVEDKLCTEMRAIKMYILLRSGKLPLPPALRQNGD